MVADNPELYSVSNRIVKLRKQPRPRVFTDEQKALVVATVAASPELRLNQLADDFGVNRRRVFAWQRGEDISEGALAMADDYKDRIKAKLEDVLERVIDNMPDKVDKANLWDLARTAGMAFDKIQLMEGKPTSIMMNELPGTDRSRMILALMERAKQNQQQAQVIDVELEPQVITPLEASNTDESSEWQQL